ncbi:MAG: hypothetical protein IID51_04415 [Proteobacteria bacterium]|nr:hypothetical protein [Pseudomonadota bacterium]
MSYNLNITIDQTQGGLLRTIGLIERRGFSILSVNLPGGAGSTQELSVRVKAIDANRSIEVLARQIERLETVRRVEMTSAQGTAQADSQINSRKPGRAMSMARAVASMAPRRPVFEDVAT